MADTTNKSRNADKPLLVRFRSRETATGGVTRDQLRELAESMGITETAAVHIAISRTYLAHFGEVHRSVVSQERLKDSRQFKDNSSLGAGLDLHTGASSKKVITTKGSMIAASIKPTK